MNLTLIDSDLLTMEQMEYGAAIEAMEQNLRGFFYIRFLHYHYLLLVPHEILTKREKFY